MIEKKYFKDTLKVKLNRLENIELCNICVDKGHKTSDYGIHTHDFSELVIITSGRATHVIGEEEYTVKIGDAFVITGDIPHGYKNVKDLELYNISFIFDKVFEDNGELKKLAGFQALFILEPYFRKEHEFNSKLILIPAKLKYAEELMCMMESEFTLEREGFIQAVHGLFLALVVFLSREYITIKNSISDRMMTLAETVAFIESHYNQTLTLQKLSDMAYFSKRHFVRVFKQNYNLTPTDYLIKLRIKHACKLLGDSSLNIAQIAQESGFSDSNYFSRKFKNETGMSPRRYRYLSQVPPDFMQLST